MDYLLSYLSVLGVLLSSYLYVQNVRLFPSQYDEEILNDSQAPQAMVEVAVNDVRRKPAQLVMWEPAENQTMLYKNDAVFTSQNSQAHLELKGKGKIILGENSLIVIGGEQDAFDFNIAQGRVLLASNGAAGGEAVRVKIGEQTAVLDQPQTKLQLQVSKEKAPELRVISGSVSIESDEGKTQLEKGESAKVTDAGVETKRDTAEESEETRKELLSTVAAPVLQRPLEGESFSAVIDEKKPILFRWQGISGYRYFVEIASDKEFKNIVKTERTPQLSLTSDVNESGKFFWRVRAIDEFDQEASSQVASFEMKRVAKKVDPPPVPIQRQGLPAPELLPEYQMTPGTDDEMEIEIKRTKRPKKGAWLLDLLIADAYAEGSEEEAVLRWKDTPGAVSYIIEISQNQEFKTTMVKDEVGKAQWTWKNPSPGRFYFRVAAKAKDGVLSPFSQPGAFVVRPPIPEITVPQVNQRFDLSQSANLAVSFKTSAHLKQFQIQVARDRDFIDVVVDRTITQKVMPITELRPGNYFVRIRGEAGETSSRFSEPRAFSIVEKLESASVNLIAPKSKATVEFEGVLPELTFSWSSSSTAKRYRLQVASDKDFKTMVFEQEADGLQLTTKLDAKSYFWRVTALSASGQSLGTSDTQTFEIKRKGTESAAAPSEPCGPTIPGRDHGPLATERPPWYWHFIPGGGDYYQGHREEGITTSAVTVGALAFGFVRGTQSGGSPRASDTSNNFQNYEATRRDRYYTNQGISFLSLSVVSWVSSILESIYFAKDHRDETDFHAGLATKGTVYQSYGEYTGGSISGNVADTDYNTSSSAALNHHTNSVTSIQDWFVPALLLGFEKGHTLRQRLDLNLGTMSANMNYDFAVPLARWQTNRGSTYIPQLGIHWLYVEMLNDSGGDGVRNNSENQLALATEYVWFGLRRDFKLKSMPASFEIKLPFLDLGTSWLHPTDARDVTQSEAGSGGLMSMRATDMGFGRFYGLQFGLSIQAKSSLVFRGSVLFLHAQESNSNTALPLQLNYATTELSATWRF